MGQEPAFEFLFFERLREGQESKLYGMRRTWIAISQFSGRARFAQNWWAIFLSFSQCHLRSCNRELSNSLPPPPPPPRTLHLDTNHEQNQLAPMAARLD